MFLAESAAAKKLLKSSNPFKAWPSLSLKGVTEFEWQAMGKVLRGEVFGPELALELNGPEGEEGGKVVRAMTDKTVAKLAALGPKERSALAKKWRQAAEGFSDWSASEVEALVTKLSLFAARAHQAREAILSLAVW